LRPLPAAALPEDPGGFADGRAGHDPDRPRRRVPLRLVPGAPARRAARPAAAARRDPLLDEQPDPHLCLEGDPAGGRPDQPDPAELRAGVRAAAAALYEGRGDPRPGVRALSLYDPAPVPEYREARPVVDP